MPSFRFNGIVDPNFTRNKTGLVIPRPVGNESGPIPSPDKVLGKGDPHYTWGPTGQVVPRKPSALAFS